MEILELMRWRYATKSFDIEKKVKPEDIDFLKKAIQLTPSSYGLQPYKIKIVEDIETKEKLFPASYYQKQIKEASHIFVFCNMIEISNDYIENFYRIKAKIQGKKFEDMIPHMENVKKFIEHLPPEDLEKYTALQTYMALETLLMAAPERKIDTCAIGGFIPAKYNEILELEDKKLNACVVAAVGYRSKEDRNQYLPKVRIPLDELFI